VDLGWLAFGAEVVDPSLAPTGEDSGIIIVAGGPSAIDPEKDGYPAEGPPAEAVPAQPANANDRVTYEAAPERPPSHRSAERRVTRVTGDTGSVVTRIQTPVEQKE